MPVPNKVWEFQLKNGFKLLVKEDHRSPIAIFQIFYKVGASFEHNGITGVSHALEHMMFRGTRKYSAEKFLHTISELGGEQNAHTGQDYTTYYELIVADKLIDCFSFEADRMQNLLLREKDFAKEIQVVMEERRLTVEDNPKNLLTERFLAAAYLSSAYHHPVIGWMNDLENMSIHDLASWYKAWYVPNNAIGIVVGDVQPNKIHQLAKKYFGPLNPSVLPKSKPQNEVAPLGMRTVVVKAPTDLPWFMFGYNTPVLNTAKEKWEPYALLLLGELLAGDSSARLQKNLIRNKNVLIDARYCYSPFNRINNIFVLSVTPCKGLMLEEIKQEIFAEIIQLQNQLVSTKELQQIKVQFIANKIYESDSLKYQAAELGGFEAVGLSWKEIDKAYKIIAATTPVQIQKVAYKYLNQDRLILGVLEPAQAEEKRIVNSKIRIKHHDVAGLV